MSSGAGICTTATVAAPGPGIFILPDPAYATEAALIAAANTLAITSCWNPSTNAQINTAGLTASNLIVACYVKKYIFLKEINYLIILLKMLFLLFIFY